MDGSRETFMLDYLSLAVSDIDKATAFYDAALAPIGASRLISFARGDIRICGYGWDGKPSRIALPPMPSTAPRWLPARRITAPGLRPHYRENDYATFVIDPSRRPPAGGRLPSPRMMSQRKWGTQQTFLASPTNGC